MCGTINNKIYEPIHFAGPSPGAQSTTKTSTYEIADSASKLNEEEKKKEQPMISQPVQPQENDQDDSLGAAQQASPEEKNLINTSNQRPIEEETKELQPYETVEPAEEAAIRATSVNSFPRVKQQPIESFQQSADPN